jgi:site-specific DNA-cytosine methylase
MKIHCRARRHSQIGTRLWAFTSFGDVASGSGAFIAAAKQVGMECAWFIEPDDATAAIAARVAEPQATRHRSMLDISPCDLPWVQALLPGPECTPFSKAGKQRSFQDKRPKTLFWAIWFISERQPDLFSFIENAIALKSVKCGGV